jgi:hypothetical protein
MRAAAGLLALVVVPAVAQAQGGSMAATPMAVDLKKATIGTWAEYTMTAGPRSGKLRWSLVGREGENHTLEMAMEGAQPGGAAPKMTLQMSLVPNPTSATRPLRRLVMQMGDMDPMEMPLDMPQMPDQRFEKPDPKKLVGKEKIKVAAGSYATSHYRDKIEHGTVDTWISETIPPLGLVKMTMTPKADAPAGPGGPPRGMTLELSATGNGAKPAITKQAKPFDPAMFGMGGGHGAPPPAPKAPASAPAAPKK